MPEEKSAISLSQLHDVIVLVLGSEKSFYKLAAVYGVIISLFSLAVPFSVQILITTLTNTALARPVMVLSIMLMLILGLYGLLVAVQYQLLERFKQRFYARVVGEISWRYIHADKPVDKAQDLNHRYFEIMTVQHRLSILITSGFALVLQAVVGILLVSFYHPAFLIFNIVFVLAIYIIWKLYAPIATRKALQLSKQKYYAAGWLDALIANPPLTPNARAMALEHSNVEIEHYLSARSTYFRYSFRQMIGFLMLYAVASAGLLAMGGSLVVAGELTLGQLVAAELVLSAIFFGLSKAGEYLDYYYDLIAAVEKLSKFLEIPAGGKTAPVTGTGAFITEEPNLRLPSFARLALPRVSRTVGKILVIFILLLVAFLSFTPWVQTASGTGTITALDPAQRTQPIHSLVKGRIKQWHVQDGSKVRKGEPIVELVDNDPQFITRLESERDAIAHKRDTMRLAMDTAQINYERQSRLSDQGLASRKEVEQAKIRWKEIKAAYAQTDADLNKIEVQFARQGTQVVEAPHDGFIMHITAGGIATQVQEGDILATFVPDNVTRAVELYVNGLDVALISPGRKVRLIFEGWPAVQFSGWPAVAIGTFAGEVVAVDASVSPNGKFRILISETKEEPWPAINFLRMGAKTKGWVLLNEVPLGFELWRQMNNFPPVYTGAQQSMLGQPKSDKNDEGK